MKNIQKDFFRYFLVILLLAATTHFVLPAATDQEGKEEKQAKESTPVSQKLLKGVVKFLKSLDFGLDIKGGSAGWKPGDFKDFEQNLNNPAGVPTISGGVDSSLLGNLRLLAEYELPGSHKLSLGVGFKYLSGGEVVQRLDSPLYDVKRAYDISSYAIPLDLCCKLPLKIKINRKPLLLRFTGGLDFIQSIIDYNQSLQLAMKSGGANELSRTSGEPYENHTQIKFKDAAVGGHIAAGLEYPITGNFGLILDAGYSFVTTDKFTGKYIDSRGNKINVVLIMDEMRPGYIAPYIYSGSICPSLKTAQISPRGFNLSFGMFFAFGGGQQQVPQQQVPPPPPGISIADFEIVRHDGDKSVSSDGTEVKAGTTHIIKYTPKPGQCQKWRYIQLVRVKFNGQPEVVKERPAGGLATFPGIVSDERDRPTQQFICPQSYDGWIVDMGLWLTEDQVKPGGDRDVKVAYKYAKKWYMLVYKDKDKQDVSDPQGYLWDTPFVHFYPDSKDVVTKEFQLFIVCIDENENITRVLGYLSWTETYTADKGGSTGDITFHQGSSKEFDNLIGADGSKFLKGY